MASRAGKTAVNWSVEGGTARIRRRWFVIGILVVFSVACGVAAPWITAKIKEHRDHRASQQYAEAMRVKVGERLSQVVQLVESARESTQLLQPWDIPHEFALDTVLVLRLPEIRAAARILRDPGDESGTGHDRQSGDLADSFASSFRREEERQLEHSRTHELTQFVDLFDPKFQHRVPLEDIRRWTEKLLRRHVVVVVDNHSFVSSLPPEGARSQRPRTYFDAFFVDAGNMTLIGTIEGFSELPTPGILKTLTESEAVRHRAAQIKQTLPEVETRLKMLASQAAKRRYLPSAVAAPRADDTVILTVHALQDCLKSAGLAPAVSADPEDEKKPKWKYVSEIEQLVDFDPRAIGVASSGLISGATDSATADQLKKFLDAQWFIILEQRHYSEPEIDYLAALRDHRFRFHAGSATYLLSIVDAHAGSLVETIILRTESSDQVTVRMPLSLRAGPAQPDVDLKKDLHARIVARIRQALEAIFARSQNEAEQEHLLNWAAPLLY